MRPFVRVLALLVIATFASHRCHAQTDQPVGVPKLAEQADELLAQQQAEKVLELFASVSEKPLPAALLRRQGKALDLLGRSDDAKKAFDAAVAQSPDEAANYLARAYHIASRNVSDSIADFKKAFELDDSDPNASADLGAALAMLGRFKEAEPYLRRSLELVPENHECLANLAEVLRRTDRVEEALGVINRVAEAKPDFWRAHFVRGLILQELDKDADAAVSYTKALELDPDDSGSRYNRGNCYYELEQFEKARADYAQCAKLSPNDDRALVSLGFTEQRLGDLDQAISHAQKATEIAADNAEAWELLGDCLGDNEQYPEALAALTKFVELQPDSADGYLQRVWVLRQMGEYKKGLADSLKALKILPNSATAHYNAGLCHHKLENWADAVVHFTTLIDSGSESGDDELWRLRAECHERLGKQPEADADIKMADKINAPLTNPDKELLDILVSADVEAYINQVSPALRGYVDADAIKSQLNRISSEYPELDLQMRRAVEPHAQHGKSETSVVFRSDSGESADEITLSILRDKNEQLLAIEISSPKFSAGTRDALKGLESAAKHSEVVMRGVFSGDVAKAVEAMPKALPEEAIKQMVQRFHAALGDVKDYRMQDIVVTKPGVSEGLPMVSVFSLIEGPEEAIVPCEARFYLGESLTLKAAEFGSTVKADYFAQDPSHADKIAKTLATGSLPNFAGLFYRMHHEEMNADEDTKVYLKAFSEIAGPFSQIRPGSVSSRVTVADELLTRKSEFVAEFANVSLPITTTEESGRLLSYFFDNDEAGLGWESSERVRDHWRPHAQSDLTVFLKGTASEMLSVLKEYDGFGSVTENQVQGLQDKNRGNLGTVESIKFSKASFSDRKWTFEFDVVGSKDKAIGYVVYAPSGVGRALLSFGISFDD